MDDLHFKSRQHRAPKKEDTLPEELLTGGQTPPPRNRIAIGNRLYFYTIGFSADCFNFAVVLGEVFLAASVFKANDLQLGVLGALNAAAYSVPCILAGMISERIGRRRMSLIAIAVIAATFYITPRVPSFTILVLVGMLRSAFVGMLWPPQMAWMAETSEKAAFSRLLGGYNVSWSLGILTGFWLSGRLFEYAGPSAPFHFSLGFACLLFLFVFVCVPKRSHVQPYSEEMAVVDIRYFVRQGLLMITFACFATGLVLYVFPKVVAGSLGEAAQGSLHSARVAGQVGAFIMFMHSKAWHFRMWPPVLAICVLTGGLAITAATDSYPLYMAGFVLLGIGTGTSYSMSAYYALALMRVKGLGSGMQETLIGFGNFAGPIYGGAIAHATMPRYAVWAGILPLLALMPVILWRGRNAKIEA